MMLIFDKILQKPVYLPNHINFRIDNFNVQELNTLLEQINLQMLPTAKPNKEKVF